MHRRLDRPTTPAVFVSVVAFAAIALSGCGGASSSSGDSSGSGLVPGLGLVKTIPLAQRGRPLDLSGTDLHGRHLDLSSYRGRVVVINIWGSWCGECRGEANGLESVAKKMSAQGVEFLGIDSRDPQIVPPQQFVKDHKVSYPSLYDPTGALLLKFPKGLFSPQFLPTTLVLDREGRPASVALRTVTSDELTRMLTPALAEKP